MDDWSWQERYSQSAFLSVPCLFPAFELRLLSGNYITAAPTNARLKTEGLLYAAYMHPVFYLHNIIQYIQNGASSSSWIWKSIFTKKLKILFSIRFLKICFFQEVHCNNMWVFICTLHSNFYQCKISDFDRIGKSTFSVDFRGARIPLRIVILLYCKTKWVWMYLWYF